MKFTSGFMSEMHIAAALAASGLAIGGCSTQQAATKSEAAPAHAAAQPTSGRTTDPYAIALTGDGQEAFRASSPRSVGVAGATESPYGFRGQVFGAGTEPSDQDPSRAGLGSLAQVSFSAEGADFDPCVTPDGQRIVFASTQHSPAADLYIKGIRSRVVTQLTSDPAQDIMPRVSPDGTRIAFASDRTGNWDIFVMPLAGGRALQVTSDATHELHPTWSPDGRSLAFCRLGEMSGKWEIWVTDVANSGVAQFLTNGLFPEWCPVAGTGQDGADRIVFQRSRERGDRSFGIWTIDYKNGQASGASEVASNATAACINPSWSPDGKWITFATVPHAGQWASGAESRPPTANLWMVSSDGGGLVSLTSGHSVNLMPTWGPDSRVYFISDRGGVDNIWTMNVAGAILAASGPQDSSSGRHDEQARSSQEAPAATASVGEDDDH